MTVDTHGLKMRGLRKAAGATKLADSNDNRYVRIGYNLDTGDVLTDCKCGEPEYWQTLYNDPAVI